MVAFIVIMGCGPLIEALHCCPMPWDTRNRVVQQKEILVLLTYNANKTYRTWAWTLAWLGLGLGLGLGLNDTRLGLNIRAWAWPLPWGSAIVFFPNGMSSLPGIQKIELEIHKLTGNGPFRSLGIWVFSLEHCAEKNPGEKKKSRLYFGIMTSLTY